MLENIVPFVLIAFAYHHCKQREIFVGVGAILAGSKHTSPAMRRRTPKPREIEPDVNIPGPDNTELLIMGIIRDKKEEKYHEAHHVINHS